MREKTMNSETNKSYEIRVNNELKRRDSMTDEEKKKLDLENKEFVKSLETVTPQICHLRKVTDRMNDLTFHILSKVEPNLSRLQRVRSDRPSTTICDLKREHLPFPIVFREERKIRNYCDLFERFDKQDFLIDKKLEMNLTVNEEFKNKLKYFRECIDELNLLKVTISELLLRVEEDFEVFEDKHL